MQINYYKNQDVKENRVDVYYSKQDEEISNLMTFLENKQVMMGSRGNSSKPIFPNAIYYLEIVDRRCFAYLEKEVYQIDFSLRLFLETYRINGFVQIGKSTVVNINHIDRIFPDFNMKMHLIMENGERLVLNRAYKKAFIAFLKNVRRSGNENN